MGSADGGTVAGCKALAMFVANVKPLLHRQRLRDQLPRRRHADRGPQVGRDAGCDALPERADGDQHDHAGDVAAVAAAGPGAGGNGHPLKVNPFTNFQTAVTTWINAEK